MARAPPEKQKRSSLTSPAVPHLQIWRETLMLYGIQLYPVHHICHLNSLLSNVTSKCLEPLNALTSWTCWNHPPFNFVVQNLASSSVQLTMFIISSMIGSRTIAGGGDVGAGVVVDQSLIDHLLAQNSDTLAEKTRKSGTFQKNTLWSKVWINTLWNENFSLPSYTFSSI